MSSLDGIRHILRSFVARTTADAETREELAYHLERQTQKHIAAGMHPRDAARLAAMELGGATRWREETAQARRGSVFVDLIADCRYALRGFASRPGFALSALLTLAIGIGAATAIVNVAEGALLRPLPFRDASRIMSISLRMPIPSSGRTVDMTWSYPKYAMLRDQLRVFSSVALHSSETLVISSPDGAERLAGNMAGASYFDILGVRPTIGRAFTPDEDRLGGPNAVVILGDAMWRTRFDAKRSVLGTTMMIGGVRHTIVGVMPPGFAGLTGDAQLWIPTPAARPAMVLQAAGAHNMELIGRIADGVSLSAARDAVTAMGARIDDAYPSDGHWGAAAYALADVRVNATIRQSLQLLAVAVVLLLVIVCVNLTTLLVTRGAARRQEFAVRLALGAGRARVVRQLIAESTMLATIGGALGLFVAAIAARTLASTLPLSTPTTSSGTDLTRLTFASIHIDALAVGFGSLLSLVVGVAIGAASALRVTAGAMIGALRQGSASARGRRGGIGANGGLVVAQIALAVMFLVASGLTLQSLRRALSVPLGYKPDGLLSMRITLDPVRAQRDSNATLWRVVLDETRAVAGVRSVAVGSCAPLGQRCEGTSITPSGHSGFGQVMYVTVSPDYFATLATRVVRGRAFEPADQLGNQRPAVINQAAAREIWGADDPLTTPIRAETGTTQIVGVVEDARYGDIEHAAVPTMFMPFTSSRGVLFVRTDADPASLVPAIRRAVRKAGSGHAVGDVQTMNARLRDATARNRLSAQVFTAFAASALLLAAIGVYGTLALRVAQRQRELAVRRALGASAATLAGMIGTQAAAIAAIGGAAGIAGAVVVSRAMGALLYDVQPLEPFVFASSVALLLVAVLVAAAVPAARSLRIDPREAMRAE